MADSNVNIGQGRPTGFDSMNVLVQFLGEDALLPSSLMQEQFRLLRYLQEMSNASLDSFTAGRAYNYTRSPIRIPDLIQYVVNKGSNTEVVSTEETEIYVNTSTEAEIDRVQMRNDNPKRIPKVSIPYGTYENIDPATAITGEIIRQTETLLASVITAVVQEIVYNAGIVVLGASNVLNEFDTASDDVPAFFRSIVEHLRVRSRSGTNTFLCVSNANYSILTTANYNVVYNIRGQAGAIEEDGVNRMFGVDTLAIPDITHTTGTATAVSAVATSGETNAAGSYELTVSTTASGAADLTPGDILVIAGQPAGTYFTVERAITIGASETNTVIRLNIPLAIDVGDSAQSVSLAFTDEEYTLNFAANLGAISVNLRGGRHGTRAEGLEDYYNRGFNLISDPGSGTITSTVSRVYFPSLIAATAAPFIYGIQYDESGNYNITTDCHYGAAVNLCQEVISIPS